MASPGAALVLGVSALALGACGAERPVASPDASPADPAGDVLAGLAARAAPVPADASGPAAPIGPPRWPADLATHPDAPFESVEWLAVLRDEGGEVRGLRQRLVRVAVPATASGSSAAPGAAAAVSPWRYDAVLRVDGALERAGASPATWSATERAAVGLAGALPAPDVGLRLLDHSLGSVGALPARGCAATWQVVVPGVARLRGRDAACPSGAGVAGTAAATGGAFPVSGSLAGEAVTGVAWRRTAWGALPVTGTDGAAVVFDRAVVALEGAGSVELLRSRRASGRGTPRTTLRALDARARRSGIADAPAIDWNLAAASGTPDAGRLRVPAIGIDVTLRALSPVVPVDGPLERVFHGAVIAEGTHRGVGFVEHRPLAPDGGIADGEPAT